MILFYVRHGEPIYDPDQLTPMGRRQAEAIGKRLALHGVDRVFASTSNRAIQTATPTAEMLGKQITQLDFCNESHAWEWYAVETESGGYTWGFADGRVRKIFSEPAVAFHSAWYDDPRLPKNNFRAGQARIHAESDAFLKSLGYEHDRARGLYKAVAPTKERVALFAHQGFGLAFLSSILDIPYPLFCMHFDIGYTNMTVVEFEERDGVVIPRVLTHSNDGHLYREGLPTKYNLGVDF